MEHIITPFSWPRTCKSRICLSFSRLTYSKSSTPINDLRPARSPCSCAFIFEALQQSVILGSSNIKFHKGHVDGHQIATARLRHVCKHGTTRKTSSLTRLVSTCIHNERTLQSQDGRQISRSKAELSIPGHMLDSLLSSRISEGLEPVRINHWPIEAHKVK